MAHKKKHHGGTHKSHDGHGGHAHRKEHGSHEHMAEQHRGGAMHLHSHPGTDELATKSKKLHHVAARDSSVHAPELPDAGSMSLAHGYNPPEHYEMGHEKGGELGANEHFC